MGSRSWVAAPRGGAPQLEVETQQDLLNDSIREKKSHRSGAGGVGTGYRAGF